MNLGGKPPMSKRRLILLNIGWNVSKLSCSINNGNHLTILDWAILNVKEIRSFETSTTTNPDTASQPRRLETTATLLCEPQISQFMTTTYVYWFQYNLK